MVLSFKRLLVEGKLYFSILKLGNYLSIDLFFIYFILFVVILVPLWGISNHFQHLLNSCVWDNTWSQSLQTKLVAVSVRWRGGGGFVRLLGGHNVAVFQFSLLRLQGNFNWWWESFVEFENHPPTVECRFNMLISQLI